MTPTEQNLFKILKRKKRWVTSHELADLHYGKRGGPRWRVNSVVAMMNNVIQKNPRVEKTSRCGPSPISFRVK